MTSELPSSKIAAVPSAARRRFIFGGLAVWAGGVSARLGAATSAAEQPTTVTIENFSRAGLSEGTVTVARIVKNSAEWHKQLSDTAYRVTRREGTEPPN